MKTEFDNARSDFSASLNRRSSTPDHGAADRDEFLREQREQLRDKLINPVAVTAFSSEWARQYGEFPDESYRMIAVAGAESHWLLYDPATRTFALAEGTLGGHLVLVGHRSDDALAEWRG